MGKGLAVLDHGNRTTVDGGMAQHGLPKFPSPVMACHLYQYAMFCVVDSVAHARLLTADCWYCRRFVLAVGRHFAEFFVIRGTVTSVRVQLC